MYAQITEPSAVAASEDFLRQVWEQVLPEHRNKQWVIAWLKHLTSTIDRGV
jgi:hypothetical protein